MTGIDRLSEYTTRSRFLAMAAKARDALGWARIDFVPAKRQPKWWRLILATAIAVGLSLGVDVALVHAGIALFPSTRGFSHFRVSDYATLTCIGVIVASAGWPVVVRISSAPRWLYLRAAVMVTLTLWLPDVWLVAKGETPRGVAVLAVMHLGIALITYNALVRIAPARELADRRECASVLQVSHSIREKLRVWWIVMSVAISVEFTLGVVALVAVPISRPTGWIPAKGKLLFALHGFVGIAALVGGCVVVTLARGAGRIARIASIGGLIGILLGGGGGLLAVSHSLRLVGMGVMFVASGVAFFAYLAPLIEPAAAGKQTEIYESKEVPGTGDEPVLT